MNVYVMTNADDRNIYAITTNKARMAELYNRQMDTYCYPERYEITTDDIDSEEGYCAMDDCRITVIKANVLYPFGYYPSGL